MVEEGEGQASRTSRGGLGGTIYQYLLPAKFYTSSNGLDNMLDLIIQSGELPKYSYKWNTAIILITDYDILIYFDISQQSHNMYL